MDSYVGGRRGVTALDPKGVIEPLEKLEIEEGKELTVTISEVPEKVEGEDPLDLTFGGWVGLIDAEELKKNTYGLRLSPVDQKLDRRS